MTIAPSRARGRRLPPEIFDLPVDKMRDGYYTDAYFNHTRDALLADGRHPRVVMQVFQRTAGDARGHGRGARDPPALLPRLGDADGARAPRRRPDRAVGHGDDDRGRLHALRAPRDGVPRHAGAPDADLDERRACPRGGQRQADHLHAGAPRPPPRADRRRLRRIRRRGPDRRSRRRHVRRAGVLVGRARRRHRAPCPDRGLRGEHGARGDEVRRVGARSTSTSPSSSTSRTTPSGPRSTWHERSARACGASAWTPPASSSTARSGRRWATSTRGA